MVRSKLRRRRRTKIVATCGPSSATPEVLARLFLAGADVFRLNFSHGTHDDHRARIIMIRALEEQYGRPIGILADVQGPKLRVGKFQAGRVVLQTGQQFRLDLSPVPGDRDRVQLPHPEIIAAARWGLSSHGVAGRPRWMRISDGYRGEKANSHRDSKIHTGSEPGDRQPSFWVE